MFSLPQKPQITKKGENKSVFEIKGLYPGYGVTVGNTLRRVLLSSLEGAVITQVKIKDVSHEFSTIPGVLEDVVFILLNLKKIRFKMFGSEPQVATLKVTGQKEVKAKDFNLPSQVEVVTKDAPIATLTAKKSYLEMEVKIKKGIGYEPAERRDKDEKKLDIGVIDIDAAYSPILNTSFYVEDMRVGKRTDFDKLCLEIQTDGTISPEQAFENACDILVKHFSLFKQDEIEKQEESKEKPQKKVVKTKKKKSQKKKPTKAKSAVKSKPKKPKKVKK